MTVTELVDRGRFLDCLARWPSGVAVVTTLDEDGTRRGFTATAFTSLSVSPPMVLVCLDVASNCLRAFSTAPAMAVHLLRDDQQDVAIRCSTKGADKLKGLETSPGLDGVPLIAGVLGRLECRLDQRITAGDHVILVGVVHEAHVGEGAPLVYHNRRFHTPQL